MREGVEGPTDFNGDGDIADRVLASYHVDTGALTLVPLAIVDPQSFLVADDHVAFLVSEANQGNLDLNGDGDTRDKVLHVHDFVFSATTNFAIHALDNRYFQLEGGRLVFLAGEREPSLGGPIDLNGDSDTFDLVLHFSTLRPDPIVLALERTANDVAALHLQAGVENSLTVKIDGALGKYLAETGNSQHAAMEKLEALIHAIDAHRDERIDTTDADRLISDIRAIIELLQEELLSTLE